MNFLTGVLVGACLGAAVTLYVFSWLVAASAPEITPEVRERLVRAAEQARNN